MQPAGTLNATKQEFMCVLDEHKRLAALVRRITQHESPPNLLTRH